RRRTARDRLQDPAIYHGTGTGSVPAASPAPRKTLGRFLRPRARRDRLQKRQGLPGWVGQANQCSALLTMLAVASVEIEIMPTIRFHIDPCPCGSKRIVKDCCLRSCGDLTPPAPRTDFTHERCYAQSFADCSTKISGEHWISHSLLKVLAPSGTFTVGGLPG